MLILVRSRVVATYIDNTGKYFHKEVTFSISLVKDHHSESKRDRIC